MSNEDRNTHLVVLTYILIVVGVGFLTYRAGFQDGRIDFAKEIVGEFKKVGIVWNGKAFEDQRK